MIKPNPQPLRPRTQRQPRPQRRTIKQRDGALRGVRSSVGDLGSCSCLCVVVVVVVVIDLAGLDGTCFLEDGAEIVLCDDWTEVLDEDRADGAFVGVGAVCCVCGRGWGGVWLGVWRCCCPCWVECVDRI